MMNTQHLDLSAPPVTPASLKTRILRSIARGGGPPSRLLAGRRGFALWGLVEVTGRRTGRAYRIPVATAPTGDGFVIPLPFGAATQWARNVIANGEATVGWNGRRYAVTDAEIVPTAAAAAYWMAPIRAVLAAVGIRDFLRVRIA